MRYSRSILEEVSNEPPAKDGPKVFQTDTGERKEDSLGPSAYQNTARPFLARLFDMGSQEILQLGLREPLQVVDEYVLQTIQKRSWTDTQDSYQKVLTELREILGIHPNVENLIALERLAKGVKLLRLQSMHRRRNEEIFKQLTKLNTP